MTESEAYRMREDAVKRMAEAVMEGLKRRNMENYYCADGEEAAKLILDMIEPEAKVTWGGSSTMKSLGIPEQLKERGQTIIEYPEEEKKTAGSPIYQEVVGADYFLMGCNAITVKGELVNIDGASNRVGCLVHGPKHVIVVAGINKLVKTVEEGIDRIQTQVCPIIADASGRKTPCGIKGICTNCNSPECMCCNIVVTRHSRYDGRIRVILVGEALGL